MPLIEHAQLRMKIYVLDLLQTPLTISGIVFAPIF